MRRAVVLVAAMALMVAACAPANSSSASPESSTPSPVAPADSTGIQTLTLPFAAGSQHTILCAYNGDGGPGCQNHVAPMKSGNTDDRYALDFDLAGPSSGALGEAVYAMAPGTVRWVGRASGGWACYGLSIAIEHANGYTSFYAHLSGLGKGQTGAELTFGDPVTTSDPIGFAGNSAGDPAVCAYEPHLHVALYLKPSYTGPAAKPSSPPYGGTAVQPEPFASCEKADGSACANLQATDVLRWAGTSTPTPTPTAVPITLAGTWVSPKAGATVKTLKLKLSAKPTASLPDVTLTKVVYSIAWGSKAPKTACAATKAAADGTWSCTADLAKLGAPLGKLTLSFDVYDDAGDVTHAPDGTRTVKFAAPPPAPTNLRVKVTDGVCPDPPFDANMWCDFYKMSWRNIATTATGIRIYESGFAEGLLPGSGSGCMLSERRIVARLRPSATSYTYPSQSSGECLWIAAFNAAGSSPLIKFGW